jgi:predicted  nucleic acid-binding Zn-ribbon protein
MDEEKTTILEPVEKQESQDPPLIKQQETQDMFPPKDTKKPTFDSKKNMPMYIIIGLLLVALLVMGYFLFFRSKGEVAGEGAAQIRQMQQMTQEVQQLESGVEEKKDEIFSLMDEYKEKTGEATLGVNALNLSEEEKKILEQRIKDEKDVSVKSLLEEILEKNNEIRDLKAKITEIEALLPKPHIVAKGENHYKVAMDFLLNEKGVEKKRAMELVERTALFDQLVPGFKVWNFYTGDAYGSSVTQGTANISPNTLIRRAKKELLDARDEAISQRDKLSEDIKTLEEKRTQLIGHVESLTEEKSSLIEQVSELNVEVNSLFYLLDSQTNLKKKGVLKSGFLKSTKLRDVSPEYFTTSIDMRTQTQIVIPAEDFGIKKIKKVVLYPKFYNQGTDYKIEMSGDNKTAIVSILDTTKFKNERIVISVK